MAGRRNVQAYRAAREEAARAMDAHPIEHVEPAKALEWTLARTYGLARHAAHKVDALTENDLTVMTAFGPMDNEWVRLEARYREELERLCINVERVGFAERLVKVEEARALLLVRAITDAAAEVGIPKAQIKKLGPAIRGRLELLQGGKQEAA